jgi:Ser/Thr protein kinase RdoA (MazF antagonist)
VAADEQLLTGGNANARVVRVRNTVRRVAGAWTPAVHALLGHLAASGFDGAPRPLGMDAEGREVLSFASGVVPWPDHFDLLRSDAALERVGRMIRAFHDSVASFVPPPGARWQALIPSEGPVEIIAHNDLAPWNLVIGDRWTFIDWDTAAPGSRLWDLAYAAHGFVPLSANPAFTPPDAAERLRTFVDAYGLDGADRHTLVPMLARRTRSMYDFLRTQSESGAQPWRSLWDEGHGDAWLADTDYIAERESLWERALLG